MVMANREGVQTAFAATALTMVGLVDNMINGLARIPFQKPLSGPGGILDNTSVRRSPARRFARSSVTRSAWADRRVPVDGEDPRPDLRRGSHPGGQYFGGVEIEADVVGGQEGIWCRAKPEVAATDEGTIQKNHGRTILYLHGGGYFGTTPNMYTMFGAALVRLTGCELFIPDYRMRLRSSRSRPACLTPPTLTRDCWTVVSTPSN